MVYGIYFSKTSLTAQTVLVTVMAVAKLSITMLIWSPPFFYSLASSTAM